MAWDLLVEELGPRLYRFFRARAFEDSLAADLVQDSLLRLYEKTEAGHFDSSRGDMVTFAFGIALNIQKETYRKEKKWQFDELEEHSHSHSSDPVESLALRKAISMLDEKERDVIQLLVDKDLQLDEIATLLDTPLNTVKRLRRTGRSRLFRTSY